MNDFRAEARLSLLAAHNSQTRDGHVILLQRKQEWLWHDFDWPHLRVNRFIDLQAGQRYYSPPSDMGTDRIQKIETRVDQRWETLRPGIDAEHYATCDSDLGHRQRPAERWKVVEDEQIEIWPIPSENADPVTLEGRLKITGIRHLRPFVADGDVADIDNQLIVLHAVAEYLASQGAKDAQLKLDQATQLYVKLRGQSMPRRRFSLFGSQRSKLLGRAPRFVVEQ